MELLGLTPYLKVLKEKINLAGKLELQGSYFEKAISLFDMLDEVWSQLITLYRKSKPLRFIPESMIPKNKETSEPMLIDDMVIDYQQTQMGDGEKEKNEIITSQLVFDSENALKMKESILENIYAIFGIDSYTLGVQKGGFDGAELSRSREQHTIRTFTTLKKYLEPVFTKMINKYFYLLENKNIVTEELNSNTKRKNDENISSYNQTMKDEKKLEEFYIKINQTITQIAQKEDFEYKIIFAEIGDFIKPSYEEKIKINGEAIASRMSSIKTSLKDLHPTWSEEELDEEVEKIYLENNISTQEESDAELMGEKESNDNAIDKDDKEENEEEEKPKDKTKEEKPKSKNFLRKKK